MPQDLSTYFSKCFVVNLDRRPDRWERIQRDVIPYWPFATLQRFSAIDGKKATPPPWWRAGAGAWGVYRSHLDILEKCLNDGTQSVCILEDDAILCEDFAAKAAAYIEAVPNNWGMLYLGGQHLDMANHPPEKVNDLVYRAWNVNRLHAFAVARPFMGMVYRWLNRKDWQTHVGENGKPAQDHIDHHLGRLHMSRSVPVYTPRTWLIGQSDGQSNICGKELETRFWKGAEMTDGQQVVAVVGPYRGGTSCVAGMLHKLGASMGQKFFQGREVDSAKGCFEALPLYQLCMRAYKEPDFKESNTRQERIRDLRQWLSGRWNHGPIIGAKHPKFCLMVPELVEAWPNVKLVVVTRPIEESVASLIKAGWWHTRNPTMGEKWAGELLSHFITERDKALQQVPADRVLHIAFHDVIANPKLIAEQLAKFVGLAPTSQQTAEAVDHVDDSLYRNRIGTSGQ